VCFASVCFSPKIVAHLSASAPDKPVGPVALSQNAFIRLSFKDGGEKEVSCHFNLVWVRFMCHNPHLLLRFVCLTDMIILKEFVYFDGCSHLSLYHLKFACRNLFSNQVTRVMYWSLSLQVIKYILHACKYFSSGQHLTLWSQGHGLTQTCFYCSFIETWRKNWVGEGGKSSYHKRLLPSQTKYEWSAIMNSSEVKCRIYMFAHFLNYYIEFENEWHKRKYLCF